MKIQNKLTTLVVGLAFSATNAFAFMGLVDVRVGGGYWASANTGNISKDTTNVDFALDNSNSQYMYARVDHFVPVIPNIRVEQLNFTTEGTAQGSLTVDILGEEFSFSKDLATSMVLNQQDFSLYWGVPGINLLTLGIIDLEWGLHGKKIMGNFKVGDTEQNINLLIPMGHVALLVDLPDIIPMIPMPDFELVHRTILGAVEDTTFRMVWALPVPIPMIDINLEAGYRIQKINTAIDSSLIDTSSIPAIAFNFEGIYYGLGLSF